jgi:hypothetical protein
MNDARSNQLPYTAATEAIYIQLLSITCKHVPNSALECLTYLFFIQEVLGWNLGPQTGHVIEAFCGFPELHHVNAEIVP